MGRRRSIENTYTYNKKIKVGAYIRLSKEDAQKLGNESESVINQRALIEDYSKRELGVEVTKFYIDDGITGVHFDREAFQEMEEDISEEKINCVIVKDLSRLGRYHTEADKYILERFPKLGVRFIAINDSYDSEKGGYNLVVPVKNLLNEQYSRDISAKVTSALTSKKKSGHFTGSFACYGYRKSDTKGKLEIDPYAAEVVKKIFNLFINGKGKKSIAKVLNAEGILCPSRYKEENGEKYKNGNKLETTSYWTYSSINKILKNQMYIGDMVQGKTNRSKFKITKTTEKSEEQWIIVKNTHEPIIDKEAWEMTQELLNKDTRVIDFNQNTTCFAGFLKCVDCGRSMTKVLDKGHIYYVCGAYRSYGRAVCSSHHISHEIIEEVILNDINSVLSSAKELKKEIENIAKSREKKIISVERDLRKFDMEISKLEEKKKKLYDDYQDDILTKKEYFKYKENYQKNIEYIIKKKDSLKGTEKDSSSNILERPWIKEILKKGKLEKLDRITVVQTINKISIGKDKEIYVDYKFSKDLENLI